MLRRVLIANRGEIALRVLRACRELEIETVAAYSEADAEALHVQLATQSVCIGPARAADSYLNQDALLTAALATGCDGVHPGYGFLSENPDFSDACAAAGLAFIGPSGDAIRKAGSKSAARDLMKAAGVPVTPGSDGPVSSVEEALAAAEAVGWPVLLKASAGGGGRGIRRCNGPEVLPSAYAEAKAEAAACFGNDEMYLEKLVLNPRHVEVQILADRQGHAIHLGDRDCSVQRRNQKLVEEAPAPGLSPELRRAMGEAAVRAAEAVGYEGAGTVEFLVDGETFYFMEMNTRIQVEHGVTELVTGVDLVRQQLRIASGLPLDIGQEDVRIRGCAIECRINAEDPHGDFRPCPGKVEFLHFPGGAGVRVDSCLYNGCTMSPYYDSLAAKV
ncbi:MAG: acetyl-CoA carboxylase biotin carboxylase subunit, partial [Oscillibacter sp.]|nr:acetyl-CoA carboxylase biotin carboxylase subunit [Oscillibacter sp.]